MNHYVYKITDPVTDEFYIGVRSCSCDILDDNYMGSMSTWKPECPKRLSKEILGTFPSRELANEYERKIIEKFFDDELNMNFIVPSVNGHNYKRKKLHGEEVDLTLLCFWVSSYLKNEIEKDAQSKNMNTSEYIRYVLRSTLDGKNISISINGMQMITEFEKETSGK